MAANMELDRRAASMMRRNWLAVGGLMALFGGVYLLLYGYILVYHGSWPYGGQSGMAVQHSQMIPLACVFLVLIGLASGFLCGRLICRGIVRRQLSKTWR